MENKHRCFRGYTPDQCPKHDLEIAKLVCRILLLAAVAIVVLCNFIR